MDHYQNPRNKKAINNEEYVKLHLGSDGCIDNIDLYVLIKEDKIVDISFEGVACAISTASTSIMSELLKGKTLKEAQNVIDNYLNMIYAKPYDAEVLVEAVAFQNTHKQPNRIVCATLGWDGLNKIINKKK